MLKEQTKSKVGRDGGEGVGIGSRRTHTNFEKKKFGREVRKVL